MLGKVRAGGGRRQATAVQTARRGELDCRFGAGHGEERTRNIWYMFVTLEVSKLSGWLNADATCRGSNGGMRCGARCTGRHRREAAGDRGARSVQGRTRL